MLDIMSDIDLSVFFFSPNDCLSDDRDIWQPKTTVFKAEVVTDLDGQSLRLTVGWDFDGLCRTINSAPQRWICSDDETASQYIGSEESDCMAELIQCEEE